MAISVLAHRTGMKHAPENSMEGFEHCHANGAAAVECDITFIEGVPFIWASRTKQSEPTLVVDDVLMFLQQHAGMTVYFDVKYYVKHIAGHFVKIPENVLWMVREQIIRPAKLRGVTDRIGFVTFGGGARLLQTAKLLDPNIATDLIIVFPWMRLHAYRRYVDAVTIGWEHRNYWKHFPGSLIHITTQARAFDMQVRGGLANTIQDIEWCLGMGMDGIWTDDVPLVASYLPSDR